MEITLNETSRLWIVTLGGTRWNNCTVDADCPGYALCEVGAAWAQDAKTCMCPLGRLMDGPLCDEPTQLGVFETSYYSVLAVFIFMLALLGMQSFLALLRINKNKPDAAAVSLLLACLAAITQAVLYPSLAAASRRLVPVDATTGDRDVSNIASMALVPIVFLLTTLACMNVSLVWIKITDNALRMKQNASVDLINFRRGVFTYYCLLLAGMSGTMAARAFDWLIIVAIIGILVVILTYVLAIYKLHALIQQFSSHSRDADSDETGSKNNNIRSSKTSERAGGSKDESLEDGGDSSPRASPRSNKMRLPRPYSMRVSSKDKQDGETRKKQEAGLSNMKYALKSIRVLSRRVIVIGLCFIVFLVLYLKTSPSHPSPETDPLLSRAALAGCFFETTMLTSFVIFYVRDTTKRKAKHLAASSSDHPTAAAAEAVVVGGSALHQISKQSSKVTSTREEVVAGTI